MALEQSAGFKLVIRDMALMKEACVGLGPAALSPVTNPRTEAYTGYLFGNWIPGGAGATVLDCLN